MKTLPDFLAPALNIISVGLNPSLNSVTAGFYFATPQNRFWKALNASTLIDEPLIPSLASQQYLLTHYKMGFTDTVKRPSASGSALRAADYRHWCPILKDKLLTLSAKVIWFHGKVAYRHYLAVNHQWKGDLDWGLQPISIGSSQVFLSPNPSPANAAFSLDELIGWYNQLANICPQHIE